MRSVTIVGTGGLGKSHRRTVVFRDSPYSAWQQLLERLAKISKHLPTGLKSLVIRITRPQVLLILAAIVAAFSVTAIYFYNQLASVIDARLQNGFVDNSVEIFSAPFKVSLGQRLPMRELIDYLHAAGYQQDSSDEVNLVGSFEVDGNSISIFPGDAASAQMGIGPVRIQADNSGRVLSLTNPLTKQRLSSASIEGELLAAVREGDRRKKIPVQFSSVPEELRNAILAIEDRRFFSHNGIDWRGIFRALRADLDQGEFVQGGSTLTQQLIKNDFLTPERSLSRKVKEAAMAVILESRLSKQEIFALYCSDVYLGQSGTFAINGVAQAAHVYFDKELNQLTLGECAFLAGLIHAPNRYSAYRDPTRALERRNAVLDAMVETGATTPESAEAAKAEPLQIKKHATQDEYGASYFIDYAQRYADDRLGVGGTAAHQRITTTIDPRLQRAAYLAVKRQTENLDKFVARPSRKGDAPEQVQGALVAMDAHTGEVLAMVGGRSYDESQLNRATDAKRQPGSAFKPFVYATALSARAYTAASLISDTPQTFAYDNGRSQYAPSDYHGGFTNREVTLRETLNVGLGNVAALAERSGLSRPRVYPSMALGTSEVTPLELAGAYTAFVNGGIALRPIPIKSIDYADKAEPPRASSESVFSPQVAYLMTSLLQSVVEEGTASKLRAMGLRSAIAGKTGTSNDGWFVGYTPKIVCAVWVGLDDNRDLRMKASDAALPMWADFMRQALDLRPELGGDSFAMPGGIVTANIDPRTGCLAGSESVGSRQELFIAGTEPLSPCFEEKMADTETVPEPDEPKPPESLTLDKEVRDESYDKITVEVCTLTGLIASPYCPGAEKRTFELGKEPVRMCGPEFHRNP
jgi:penicillin-binding protein 1B